MITKKKLDRVNWTFEFIKSYMSENGWSPSVREIAKELGVGVSAAKEYLDVLEAQGRIVRGNGSRMVRVVDDERY